MFNVIDFILEFSFTWLLALANVDISRCNSGIWDLKNGNTDCLNGKFVISCNAILNSSAVKVPPAHDKINVRTLSPISFPESCPNCTKVPKKRLIFIRALAVSCKTDVEPGGGVVAQFPFTIGGELPLRSVLGNIKVCWLIGEIGECGAIALAPSGESGVLHWSLPGKIKKI